MAVLFPAPKWLPKRFSSAEIGFFFFGAFVLVATGCFFVGGRLVIFFFGVGFVLVATGCFLLGVFLGVLGFLDERQSAIAAIDLGDGVGKSGMAVVVVGASSGGMEVEGRGRLLGDSAYLIPATR